MNWISYFFSESISGKIAKFIYIACLEKIAHSSPNTNVYNQSSCTRRSNMWFFLHFIRIWTHSQEINGLFLFFSGRTLCCSDSHAYPIGAMCQSFPWNCLKIWIVLWVVTFFQLIFFALRLKKDSSVKIFTICVINKYSTAKAHFFDIFFLLGVLWNKRIRRNGNNSDNWEKHLQNLRCWIVQRPEEHGSETRTFEVLTILIIPGCCEIYWNFLIATESLFIQRKMCRKQIQRDASLQSILALGWLVSKHSEKQQNFINAVPASQAIWTKQ